MIIIDIDQLLWVTKDMVMEPIAQQMHILDIDQILEGTTNC